MSWFEEQIRTRKDTDEAVFSNANRKLADVVTGQNTAGQDSAVSTEAAMAQILHCFGVKPTLIPSGITEVNDKLEYLLRPSGIMRRTVCLEKGWSKDGACPMLAFLKENRKPVALIPCPRGGYDYRLGDVSKKRHVTAELEDQFDNDAIVFYKPLPLHKLGFMDIVRFNFESHTQMDRIRVFLFLGIATLIQMLSPQVSKVIFSTLIYSDNMQLFWAVAIFLVSLSVSSVMFRSLQNLVLARINNRTSTSFEAAMVMRLLSLPAGFYRENSAGLINNRMYNCRQMSSFINNLIYSSLLSSLFSLVYIGQVIRYAPAIAPAAVGVIAAQIILYIGQAYVQTRVKERQLKFDNKESGLAYSTIYGMQKIKLVGAEKRIYGQWAEAFAKSGMAQFRLPIFMVLAPVLITAASLIGQIFIYALGLASHISVSDYYAFNTAYGLVSGAIFSLSALTNSVTQIRPLYEQLRPILEAEPEVDPARKVVSGLKGRIELDDVCFRYDPAMPNVVDHLNLNINPGEYLAIVGRTGCGKSTILRLLLGFEKPDSGIVTYDGADLQTLDLRSLRRSIGVVLQDGKLFQGDIYSNIVISAPWLTEEEAWEAARMAGLEDDIKHMPMGMHTMINSNSGGVSGGQRQRIMIARAIASRPRILMFDEATSALDNVTQKIVSDSLEQLNCTRIVIAHRLSTIRQCDRIIMMDGGHIVEDGTYDELIAKGGVFADMVARQQVSYDPEE